MTTKDHELIAKVFSDHRSLYEGRTDSVVTILIENMAQTLSEYDPTFDVTKFIRDCGLKVRSDIDHINADEY